METPKARNGSSEVPKKVSPRAARQLKVPVAFGSSSPASPSTNATKTPKDRSPKVPERKSPRSPSVLEKKPLTRVTELETQISELQDDLKKVKDQLTVSKKSKEEAEANAQELKQQLAAVSSKLEESQKQLSDLCASKEAHVSELKGISEEKDQAWENQLEVIRKQKLLDSSALASALDEVETLKQQLETVTRYENAENESTEIELQSLKENLRETLFILESMKTDMDVCKQSEAKAQELVRETLVQLEEAKETVNALQQDGLKNVEASKLVALELEKSRARVFYLEGVVNELKAQLAESNKNASRDNSVSEDCQDEVLNDNEVVNLRSEVRRLKSALEAAGFRHRDEQEQSSVQIKNACELADQITSDTSMKMAALELELTKAKSVIEELRANLLDKENELQGISEENDSLNSKLEKSMMDHQEDNGIERLREEIANLKEVVQEKELELQSIMKENKTLKSELENRREEEVVKEDSARLKLEVMMEDAEKSKRRAERAAEQLEAAQAGNAELEAELRKLKVQSDQWRKAAEAAAAMLSTPGGGNGRFVERTGSLDNKNNAYSPLAGRMGSPFMDDYDDDDAYKKKNGNVLRKIGGFWKKPQK